jgi:hypothetical protein
MEQGYEPSGHAMAEVVGHQPVTTESSLCGICGGKSGIGTSFPKDCGFPHSVSFYQCSMPIHE